MRCEEAEELLLKQRDGELSDAEARLLEEHVGACERCRRFRDALGRVEGFLKAERGAPPVVRDPSALWARVSRDLAERKPDRAETGGRPQTPRVLSARWLRVNAVAAGVVAVVGLMVAYALWGRATAARRDVTARGQAAVRAPAREGRGLPSGQGTEKKHGAANLEQSGELYRELADFYRVPVLWVAETDEGVEMKLASEPVRSASTGDAEVILAVVTLRDKWAPSVRTSVRVTSRPGEHVTATLEGWRPAPGHWHLECVVVPTEQGEVDVGLTVRYADDAGQATLATQATVAPGVFTELGSLTASNRLYEVEVVTQRAKVTGVGTGAKLGGGTL